MVHAFLRKDALVEVFTDNEWWDARCVVFNKNFVRVHYVGGLWLHLVLLRALPCCLPDYAYSFAHTRRIRAYTGDDEDDEWLAVDSDRIREHCGSSACALHPRLARPSCSARCTFRPFMVLHAPNPN